MKRINTFLSIIVFAVCAAFNVPAMSRSPKPLGLKLKAEKIERVAPAASKQSNFRATDRLVFYESSAQSDFTHSVRAAVFVIQEKFSRSIGKLTKISGFRTIYYRRLEFAYV